MSKIIGCIGSIWFGYSALEYTRNLIVLAFLVVVGYLAWKYFIDALKIKKNGSD